MWKVLAIASTASLACGAQPASPSRTAQAQSRYRGGEAPHSQAADRMMLTIPAGQYIAGSTPEEREQAYDDHRETAGNDAAREHRFFAREADRHVETLPGFRIDQHPVTNAAYAEFIRDTGAAVPAIDQPSWDKQGLSQSYDTEVARFNWTADEPPAGREDHPVVLITWEEAAAYCAWRGDLTGQPRRLPTEGEFEKGTRGAEGAAYPWGNIFMPDKLNSRVSGPGDTVPVGSFPGGASPHGMLDAAGNIAQWTATPWLHSKDSMTVKGSSWDDYAGAGRGASRHGQHTLMRHAIVGFRCAADL